MGINKIGVDYTKNEPSMCFLFHLFTTCFERGIVPDAWRKVLITPLAENKSGDLGDPGNYRGISLQSVILKVLCTILNNRLASWLESNNIIAKEQNGFRPGRSCMDHIFTFEGMVSFDNVYLGIHKRNMPH